MQYLIILGVLVVIALILIVIIIVALMKGKQQGSEEEYAEEYDEEYEDEPGREEPPRRRRRTQKPDGEGLESTEESEQSEAGELSDRQNEDGGEMRSPRSKPKKKQWKLVLENEASWQKHSYVFYDNVGIGRSRSNSVFEKYLSVPDDPRVSKVHCAIIQNEGKLYLKDLGARNGTYLNGKRISQPVLIQRDDVISLGETKIEVKSIMKEKQETEE